MKDDDYSFEDMENDPFFQEARQMHGVEDTPLRGLQKGPDGDGRKPVLFKAILIGAGVFGLGMVLLFTVGVPMGWPFGWWFNAGFILMGSVFVTVGTHMVLRGNAKVDNLVFIVVGIGIVLFAVFKGRFCQVPTGAGKGELKWKGHPKAVRACQNFPFYACLARGQFSGRFEGVYLVSVEPDGRVGDIVVQSKLPPRFRQCIEGQVKKIRIKGYKGGRMAVACQFIGKTLASEFEVHLQPGYRKLAQGEPLVKKNAGSAGGGSGQAASRGAGDKDDGAVAHPNVKVEWSNVLASPNCTFWSGPGKLGSKDRLGKSALLTTEKDGVTLFFGGAASFSGKRVGEKFQLVRKSMQERGRWTVTETMELKSVSEGGSEALPSRRFYRGTYRYSECDRTGKQGCPGRCKIQADMVVRPVR